jgi:hypothetical protein
MNTEFCNNKEEGSIYLKISIVEPILVSCIDGVSFPDMILKLQEISSKTILKEYLFHLVTGLFIKYNGKKKIFQICNCGLELLYLIYIQKRRNIVDYAALSLKVE